jgi:hypothetical protein
MAIQIIKMGIGILGMIISLAFLIIIARKPVKDSKLQVLAMGINAGDGATSKSIKTITNVDEEDTDLLVEENTELL